MIMFLIAMFIATYLMSYVILILKLKKGVSIQFSLLIALISSSAIGYLFSLAN